MSDSGDYARRERHLSTTPPRRQWVTHRSASLARHAVCVQHRSTLHQARDDLAVELRHRVAPDAGQPVGEDEAALTVVADPVAGELLVDERLHPGVGFFG